MHFSAELPQKVDVAFEFFASDRVKIISQQHAIGILPRAESEQEFTKFEGSSVTTFAAQYIDVLKQALTECFVERFTVVRQVHLDNWNEKIVCVFALCSLNKLEIKRKAALESIKTPF